MLYLKTKFFEPLHNVPWLLPGMKNSERKRLTSVALLHRTKEEQNQIRKLELLSKASFDFSFIFQPHFNPAVSLHRRSLKWQMIAV